jgi:putative aminopeptidase FrvX
MDQSPAGNRDFETVTALAKEAATRCTEFLRDLVTVPSPSRGERLACERVMREMELLGFRDVHLDEMGSVLGPSPIRSGFPTMSRSG